MTREQILLEIARLDALSVLELNYHKKKSLKNRITTLEKQLREQKKTPPSQTLF